MNSAQAPLSAAGPRSAHRLVPTALGVLAVLVFALTIPMTRVANGSLAEPQLPPLFVALGRGALAGALAALHLILVRASWPQRAQWPWFMGVVLGGVLAFPLCMGWAVRVVPGAHAAVIIGALPLCTAALAAWWLRQRPGRWFWRAAVAGCLAVTGYAAWCAGRQQDAAWALADAWLILAMLGAAVAYVCGAILSRQMPAARVISWALVLAWPVTVPAAFWLWPEQPASWPAWAALAYVALASSWLGFFAWYAALARDPMRVSQIQLLQPFASVTFSAWLLSERIDALTVGVALLVLLLVVLAQRR